MIRPFPLTFFITNFSLIWLSGSDFKSEEEHSASGSDYTQSQEEQEQPLQVPAYNHQMAQFMPGQPPNQFGDLSVTLPN